MGAAGSAIAQRKVKQQLKTTAQRYAPPALADRARQRVTSAATGLVDDVRDAFDEGRAAANDRQHELRDRLGVGTNDRAASDRGVPDRVALDRADDGHVASVTELHPGHPSGAGRPGHPSGPNTKPGRFTRLRRRG